LAGRSGGSKNFHVSKYKVKFDTSTVRTWVLPLLRRIEAGDYPTKAGSIIGLSRQHTWYYIRKLEKCHLIRREKRSNCVFYELTSQSKNLLASCEGTVFPARLYRFDKCQVAYEIIAAGLVPENFKKVEMTNWTALLGTELGVRVRKTTRSWIVHVEVIRGRNPFNSPYLGFFHASSTLLNAPSKRSRSCTATMLSRSLFQPAQTAAAATSRNSLGGLTSGIFWCSR
jgi:hypothetical protein